jgi:hypothetical protein
MAVRRDFGPEFRFSLGYNCGFYDSTNSGDRAFIAHAGQFAWFNHLPRHEHVVGRSMSSAQIGLLFATGLQFETKHGLGAFRTPYMVTPLHEGIWPPYDPLYDAFERYKVTRTSTPTVARPAAYGSVLVGHRTNLGLQSSEFSGTQVSDETLTLLAYAARDSIAASEAVIFYVHQANFARDRIGNKLISRVLELLAAEDDFSVDFVPAAEAVCRQTDVFSSEP